MINKRKWHLVTIVRHLVQLIAFLVIPGLFASTLTAIKSLVTMIVTGHFVLNTFLCLLVFLSITMLTTMLFGRFFCGFFCSFGAMQDLLWEISKRTIKWRKKIPSQVDRLLKWVKWLVLFVFLILWILQIDYTNDPWRVFAKYTSLSSWQDGSSFLTLGGALLILIMIGSLFIERGFCRYFCPLGAIYSLLAKVRLFKFYKPHQNCGQCQLCSYECAMGIDLSDDVITSGECVECMKCVSYCPKQNVKAYPDERIMITASAASIAGLYDVGTIVPHSSETLKTSQTTTKSYTNGTYTGSGQGFRGTTSVKVIVKNHQISSITVTSYQDDEQYFSQAKSAIIDEVIKTQSTDVSTVSGATYSSQGLIEAIKNALSNKSSSASETESDDSKEDAHSSSDLEDSSSSSDSSSEESSSLDFHDLKDGTYTGSGTGLRGTTKVKVVVKNKKVTSITVTSYEDDQQYFESAETTVINNMIKAQSLNVDGVSGATFSSNSIKEAVAKALSITYTNPNDSMSSEGGHHGGFH